MKLYQLRTLRLTECTLFTHSPSPQCLPDPTSFALSAHNNTDCFSWTSLTPHTTQHIKPHTSRHRSPSCAARIPHCFPPFAVLHTTQSIKEAAKSVICNNGSTSQVCIYRPNTTSRHHAHPDLSFPHLPDFSKEVTIVINEEEPDLAASFHVPEGLLTEKSEFFQAACRNEWKEASSRVVKLPDVEPEIFSLYLFWVHRGKLAVRNGRHPRNEESVDDACAVQLSLVKLWILADRLGDIELRNAVIDEMVNTARHEYVCAPTLFSPEITVLIWSATTARRSLHTLLIDLYLSRAYAGDVQDLIDKYHPEFLKELLVAALFNADHEHRECNSPFLILEEQPCYYHDHDDKFTMEDCLEGG